jgi:prophage antirepressor-like protein
MNITSPPIQTFDFVGDPVRILDRGGQPWFVAADVCRVLALSNVTEATRALDDDELRSEFLNSGGQSREMSCISESGLYALIFRSRKEKARAFRRWVTSEVLPAIRATGGYGAPANEPPANQFMRLFDEITAKGVSPNLAASTCAAVLGQARPPTRLAAGRPHTLLPADAIVLDLLRASGGLSWTDLFHASGLLRPTFRNSITRLAGRGLIQRAPGQRLWSLLSSPSTCAQ